MYAKLITYEKRERQGPNEPTFITKEHMFEGEQMTYSLMFACSKAEWNDIEKHLGHIVMLTDLPKQDESFEFIALSLHDETGFPTTHIAAADASLFIMNDNGKTIDKVERYGECRIKK